MKYSPSNSSATQLRRPRSTDVAALRGESPASPTSSAIARRARQRGEIQAAEPGDRAEPVRVERVVLVAVDEAVAVAVLGDQPLDGLPDARPVAFQPGRVGAHLVLAQGAQDGAGLGVHGGDVVELAAEMRSRRRVSARGRSPPARGCRAPGRGRAARRPGRIARRGRKCRRSSRRPPSP